MTIFWSVETQFPAECGWTLVGGIASEQQLHIIAEGPNPDPRRPDELLVVEPPADAQATATVRLANTKPPTTARFPLYVLKIAGPDRLDLPSRGTSVSWSGRVRGERHPPSVLNAVYEKPPTGVRLLAAALYDDDELLGTGKLVALPERLAR